MFVNEFCDEISKFNWFNSEISSLKLDEIILKVSIDQTEKRDTVTKRIIFKFYIKYNYI